ncbi:hypothetical protein GQ43DRAFT_202708 [Delitschia confertaspora ATCC 74209]|uniref:Uncharacterized protein n=1 Tax=Delitschia confertaspora ATCC 74209 TaxID=1513339 RepID=A0A9P4JJ71_9PLEO|nr:hypothetical protein GQ43DRAFT_202708 [Delitschia confertaspora ATCC 74209]
MSSPRASETPPSPDPGTLNLPGDGSTHPHTYPRWHMNGSGAVRMSCFFVPVQLQCGKGGLLRMRECICFGYTTCGQ